MATTPASANDIRTLPRTPFEIVGPEIDKTRVVANDALADANVFLDQILNFAINNAKVDQISVNLPESLQVASQFRTPNAPTPPTLNITVPDLPSTFTPGDVRKINIDQITPPGALTATEPTLNFPTKPNPLDVQAPTDAPTIKTDFEFPNAPDTALPSAPTFRELEIPTVQAVNIPTFDQLLPNADGIHPPNVTFNWGPEDPYSSALLSAISSELLDRISNGGTGLNPDVEKAIFDRGRDRERVESISTQENILAEQAARGLTRPAGSTLAALDQTAQDTQNKIADLSREIMIEQARLEQRNLETSIQSTIALEQTLISHHNDIQNRAFQAQQLTQQFAIDIFNVQVAKLNVELDVYRAFSAAFEAQVRAELAKIEIFKSEIEAQRLISEINKDDLQLYLGQIEAVKVDTEIFSILINAINSQIQAEGLKLENFRTQVDTFRAQVDAKRSEFAIFKDEIDGERLKNELYREQINAFVSRVQAYSAQVDAEATVATSDIQNEEIRLRQYLAQLDTILKQTQASTEAHRAAVDIFRGESDLFSAQVGAESQRLNVELKQLENNILNSRAVADLALKNAEITLRNAESTDRLLLDALRAGADVSASIGGSALAALNVGAQLSGSGSSNYNENHNFEELTS